MTQDIGTYLIPAIGRRLGLSASFAGTSPSGAIVHVSLWESDAHAQQVAALAEMTINPRRDAEAVGVRFTPIVNCPINWRL
jgi:hypothetical protein